MSINPNALTDSEAALITRTISNLDRVQRMFGQKRFRRDCSFRLAVDVARVTLSEWIESCATPEQRQRGDE